MMRAQKRRTFWKRNRISPPKRYIQFFGRSSEWKREIEMRERPFLPYQGQEYENNGQWCVLWFPHHLKPQSRAAASIFKDLSPAPRDASPESILHWGIACDPLGHWREAETCKQIKLEPKSVSHMQDNYIQACLSISLLLFIGSSLLLKLSVVAHHTALGDCAHSDPPPHKG